MAFLFVVHSFYCMDACSFKKIEKIQLGNTLRNFYLQHLCSFFWGGGGGEDEGK